MWYPCKHQAKVGTALYSLYFNTLEARGTQLYHLLYVGNRELFLSGLVWSIFAAPERTGAYPLSLCLSQSLVNTKPMGNLIDESVKLADELKNQ